MPQEPDLWANWAICRETLGDLAGAIEALRRAASLAEERADSTRLFRVQADLVRLEAISPRPPD
jgi:hypothetical protein